MAKSFGVTRMRLERLGDERDRTNEKIQDLLELAEDEKRDLADFEQEQVTKYRTRVEELEVEIIALATDLERAESSKDISKLVREDGEESDGKIRRWATPRSEGGPAVYRTFAEFARDQLILHEKHGPQILPLMGGDPQAIRAEAEERLQRTLQNVTSTTVAGLVIPSHMTEIMDIIDRSRPVVASGRQVPLDRGSMTYPVIGTRPSVVEQTSEKTEAGTVAPAVSSATLTAKTYLGATNVSWQAANWSTPDVLSLYFDLAAEAYARATENRACDVLEDAAIGTVGTASGRLGTAGTESFSAWRAAVVAGLQGIYAATSGRHRTNTLYLSAGRFFQLAALGSDQTLQMSPVGSLDVGSMTGNFFGLNVVGSYGFDQDVAILGDSGALLIGENPGSPVEMRVIEPAIGGWEVGLIGAFNAAVFDVNRFFHLGTHL
jgi:HK97 family phage major capsid protein